MKNITLAVLFLFGIGTVYAGSNSVNTEDNRAGVIEMNEAYSADNMTRAELRAERKANRKALRAEKKQIRAEKRMAKFNKRLQKYMNKKALGGLDDPIDKWLWFSIIGAAAAIVFSFIFWPLSALLWLGAVVCLVLWIIKKYG